MQHAAAFARLGVRPPRGVLLHGPPGCCKTTLARAAATAAAATLLPLSGADVFSMYVDAPIVRFSSNVHVDGETLVVENTLSVGDGVTVNGILTLLLR